MSLKEICELGSILQCDDREKIEIEKKIISLTVAIKHQEGRVSYFIFIFMCFQFLKFGTFNLHAVSA
jgi:hypothetical protein